MFKSGDYVTSALGEPVMIVDYVDPSERFVLCKWVENSQLHSMAFLPDELIKWYSC